jgi:hypothetical protein
MWVQTRQLAMGLESATRARHSTAEPVDQAKVRRDSQGSPTKI